MRIDLNDALVKLLNSLDRIVVAYAKRIEKENSIRGIR
jgi:hypothetical protein